MHIIPAILEKDLDGIETRLLSVRGAADIVQIDVVDGVFAPNKTWPYAALEQHDELNAIMAGARTFPHADDFGFQFDLMVADPAREAPHFAELGAGALIVHARAEGARAALLGLQERRRGDAPLQLGVALASGAQVEEFRPFKPLCDFVQVMGIPKPGFQGEAFDKRALSLTTSLRAAYPDLTIQVDGGVTRANARELAEAGADRLVAGHDIFDAADAAAELNVLRALART